MENVIFVRLPVWFDEIFPGLTGYNMCMTCMTMTGVSGVGGRFGRF